MNNLRNNSDSSDIIERIRSISRTGSSKPRSIVDTLLQSHWCETEDLERAYTIAENTEQPIAILFCQLPFRVRLPEKWIPISGLEGNPYVYFRTVGTEHNTFARGRGFRSEERESFTEFEHYEHAELPDDRYGLLVRTQVLLSIALWGRRAEYYSAYLATCQSDHRFRKLLVDGGRSWRPDHTGITSEMYEIDLFDRLSLAAHDALKAFFKVYAVACKDPLALSWRSKVEQLVSCFMMVQNGRLVVPRAGNSPLKDFVVPFKNESYEGNYKGLRRYLSSGRRPTEYELYLLNAEEQFQEGRVNLAIVQVAMVLEWFANVIIEEHLVKTVAQNLHDDRLRSFTIDRIWETPHGRSKWRVRISVIDKYREYFPLAGVVLPDDLVHRLERTIQHRNTIVHRTQTKEVDAKIGREAINVGLEIIRQAMDQLLSRNGTGAR
jgi:hypothetical protein